MKKERRNRRDSLERSGGALARVVAFPYLVPASSLGRDGTVSPSNRITLGCVGLGWMGTGNMEGFLRDPEVRVLAVCDVDSFHLDRAKETVDSAKQTAARSSLGSLKSTEIDSLLVRKIPEVEPKVRVELIRSLAQRGLEGLAPLLGLSNWPDIMPLPDRLSAAKSSPSPWLRVLALRGYIKLVGKSSNRPPEDNVKLLQGTVPFAVQAQEKRAILGLLPGFPCPEALVMAEGFTKDSEVAKEAELAVSKLRK